MDTGTSLILVSAPGGEELIQAIGVISPSCDGVDLLPPIKLDFGGEVFELPAWAYVVRVPNPDGEGWNCRLGIKAIEDSRQQWLLGHSFLRAFYTVFDFGKRRVGLASLPSPHFQ